MESYRFIVRDKESFQTFALPDFCPFCQKHSALTLLQGYVVPGEDPYLDTYKIVLRCYNSACGEIMMGVYYFGSDGLVFQYIEGGNPVLKSFSKTVKEISSDFVKIHKQSETAEQFKLLEICGVGYRRALEFLVKDYAIKVNPEKEPEIKSMLLANCIQTFIRNERIKSTAERAVWVGNDETHYERRWLDKTLKDLKMLIDLTVHFIEMEELYKSSIESMPNPKSKKV